MEKHYKVYGPNKITIKCPDVFESVLSPCVIYGLITKDDYLMDLSDESEKYIRVREIPRLFPDGCRDNNYND